MFDFTKVDEVRLGFGPHKTPGGRMCFMEMVAWFEGEAHSDKPACACPVLGRYGMTINDAMPDDLRDCLLKPLVPLMAGTRDKSSEHKRAEFLVMWAVNRILPIVLRANGFKQDAVACEMAKTLEEAGDAAYAVNSVTFAAACAATDAAYAAARAAIDAAEAAPDADDIWPLAVEGLRRAILIGRHDGFSHVESLEARHAALRELVGAAQMEREQ